MQIIQGDFRDLVALSSASDESAVSSLAEKENNSAWGLNDVASRRCDLITGTPPYFRVDFTSSKNTNESERSTKGSKDEVITSAVIQQGGVSTSMQSALARCEFCGGLLPRSLGHGDGPWLILRLRKLVEQRPCLYGGKGGGIDNGVCMAGDGRGSKGE